MRRQRADRKQCLMLLRLQAMLAGNAFAEMKESANLKTDFGEGRIILPSP